MRAHVFIAGAAPRGSGTTYGSARKRGFDERLARGLGTRHHALMGGARGRGAPRTAVIVVTCPHTSPERTGPPE